MKKLKPKLPKSEQLEDDGIIPSHNIDNVEETEVNHYIDGKKLRGKNSTRKTHIRRKV